MMLVSARKREQGTASSGVVYNLRHLHCSRRRYVLCERVGSPWSPRELWATISSLAGVWTAGFVLFNASTAVMNPSLVNLVRCMTIVLGVAVGERYSVATLATLMPLTHPPTTHLPQTPHLCVCPNAQTTHATHARTHATGTRAHTTRTRACVCDVRTRRIVLPVLRFFSHSRLMARVRCYMRSAALLSGRYELIKRRLVPDDGKLSALASMATGGCAGVATWVSCMPADTVNSRYQTAPVRISPVASALWCWGAVESKRTRRH